MVDSPSQTPQNPLAGSPLFYTKNGYKFEPLSPKNMALMRAELFSEYGLIPAQLTEASSYSMAMVVRYALGLFAKDGKVAVLVNNSLCGAVALGTLRHLVNAGAEGTVIIVEESKASPDLELQLNAISKLSVEIEYWSRSNDSERLLKKLGSCHNMLLGLFRPNLIISPILAELIDGINDLATPIHTLDAPLGLDIESGKAGDKIIFASSTLSLGAPLTGLYAGSEYVGRHYLCDLSIPRKLYSKYGADLSPLFSEQPVLQIFPYTPEVEKTK